MMQILKSRETTTVDSEADQGYSSARTSPNLTPCTSPQYRVSPAGAAATCGTTSTYLDVNNYRQQPDQRDNDYNVLDLDESAVAASVNVQHYYNLPTAVDMSRQRVDHPADYRYCRSSRLLEASLDSVQPSASVAVKRGLEASAELERKRYRLTAQMSQVVL